MFGEVSCSRVDSGGRPPNPSLTTFINSSGATSNADSTHPSSKAVGSAAHQTPYRHSGIEPQVQAQPDKIGSTAPVSCSSSSPSCRCPQPQSAVKKTVLKDSPNKGRVFWVCAKARDAQCNYFEWDEDVCKRLKRVSTALGDESERPTKYTCTRSVSIQIELEDINTLSLGLPAFLDPELKKALLHVTGAVTHKVARINETKLLFPLAHWDAVEVLAKRHNIRLSTSIPRSIMKNIRAYQNREITRLALNDDADRSLDEILPPSVFEKLMDFQCEGVRFAILRGGRCLIGDDMGLGKTLQAIAVARIYSRDWPLLIICPSSLRLNWREEILKWLEDDVHSTDINVVMKGSDCDKSFEQVNIVSYELVQKICSSELRKCQVIIADESHYLKSAETKRTKFIVPLIRNARRALLLSGTPALSRPVELFSQINALEPDLFPSYREFAERYCNAHQTRWGWDVNGSSHLDELHTLLRGSCLIRRRKDDVLTQLPPKQRQVLWVETKSSVMKEIRKVKQELDRAQCALDGADSEEEALACTNAIRGANNKLYALTGEAKFESVKQFMKDSLEGDGKLIVFGHHKEVLTNLNEFLRTKLKVKTILIDGNTPQGSRQALCHDFQNKADCRVAVLSITAAGVGLTLTAASVVVFAELYWNPGSLLQAEDRAHRIGQRDSVLVKYLLARETLDESMWSIVRKKLNVVGKSLTGAAVQMTVVPDTKPISEEVGAMDKYLVPRQPTSSAEEITTFDDVTCSIDQSGSEELTPPVSKLDGSMQNRSETHCNGVMQEILSSNCKNDDHLFPLTVPGAQTNLSGIRNKSFLDADLALAKSMQRQFDNEAATRNHMLGR